MNTLDRPEGFKEKRAELTAQRLHRLGADALWHSTAAATSAPANSQSGSRNSASPARPASAPKAKPQPATVSSPPNAVPEANLDDIPF
jgi:single-stranded DNA-binding protein